MADLDPPRPSIRSPATDVATLPNVAQFGGANAATEAFDEPLTREQVTAIVTDFVIGPPD